MPKPDAHTDPDSLLELAVVHQVKALAAGHLTRPEVTRVYLCANCEGLSWDLQFREGSPVHRLSDLTDLAESGIGESSSECAVCGAMMGEGAIVRVGYTAPFPGERAAIHARVAFRAGDPLAIAIWRLTPDGAKLVADDASEEKMIAEFGRPFSVAGAWQEVIAAAMDEERAQGMRLAEGYHILAIPARETKEATDREVNALASRLRYEDPVDAGLTDPEQQGIILRGGYHDWASSVAHLIREAKVTCRVFADRTAYLRAFAELGAVVGLTVMAQGSKLTVIRGGFTERVDIDTVILDSIYFARLPRESCARFVSRLERQLVGAARMKELLSTNLGPDAVEVVDGQVELHMGRGFADRLDLITPARAIGASAGAILSFSNVLATLARNTNLEFGRCPCGAPAILTKRIVPLYWSPGSAAARKSAGGAVEIPSEGYKTLLASECPHHVLYLGQNQLGNWELPEAEAWKLADESRLRREFSLALVRTRKPAPMVGAFGIGAASIATAPEFVVALLTAAGLETSLRAKVWSGSTNIIVARSSDVKEREAGAFIARVSEIEHAAFSGVELEVDEVLNLIGVRPEGKIRVNQVEEFNFDEPVAPRATL